MPTFPRLMMLLSLNDSGFDFVPLPGTKETRTSLIREAASKWMRTGLPETEIAQWLAAGVIDANVAMNLESRGVTPLDAAQQQGVVPVSVGRVAENKGIVAALSRLRSLLIQHAGSEA